MISTMVHNAVYNILYRLMNVLFPLLSVGYVSRVISPEGVGSVAYAQNIVSYFVMFASMGIPDYGIREASKLRNDERAISRLCTELLIINGIATVLMLFCYWSVVRWCFTTDILLYVAVGLELLFCFINIDWFYQGIEEYGYITLRSTIVKILCLISLFIFVKTDSDYILYAIIHCAGIGCNQCFNMIRLRKYVRLTTTGLALKRHLSPIAWMMLSTVFASLYNKVDITMLGAMASLESVAYYTNAHKIVSIIMSLVIAVTAIFLPRLSYVYAKDPSLFSEYVAQGLKIVMSIAIPACVGIILVADNLVTVMFGPAFQPSSSVLQILSVFTIVKGLGDMLCYQAIISSGNERILVKSRIAGGCANVLLNALLIPWFGYNGAAIASVASELVVNGILLPQALRITKVRIPGRFLSSVLLSTGIMALCVHLTRIFWKTGTAALVVSVLTGIVGYGIMMLVTRNELTTLAANFYRNRKMKSCL